MKSMLRLSSKYKENFLQHLTKDQTSITAEHPNRPIICQRTVMLLPNGKYSGSLMYVFPMEISD